MFISLIVILLGLILSDVSDSAISVADTTIADSELTSSVVESDNSDSPSASMTITMYALPEEKWI